MTDGADAVAVTYAGILPDLFREGQGVVALGTLGPDGLFRASEVLARHDESYMPPEVADALKRSGHWNPAEGGAPPAATWNQLEPARPDAGRGREAAGRRRSRTACPSPGNGAADDPRTRTFSRWRWRWRCRSRRRR